MDVGTLLMLTLRCINRISTESNIVGKTESLPKSMVILIVHAFYKNTSLWGHGNHGVARRVVVSDCLVNKNEIRIKYRNFIERYNF